MTGVPPPSWEVDPAVAGAREIRPLLWRLRLPVAWAHMDHVNAYALPDPDGGLVLVDCGMGGHPSTLAALEHALAQLGRSVADVRELIITHYHSDHMGNAAAIQAASGCTVWGHRRYDEFLELVMHPERTQRERRAYGVACGASGALLDAIANVGEEVDGTDTRSPPDRLLDPGTEITSRFGPWQVIELPGHSPSQVGLFHAGERLLIGADALLPVFASFCELTRASEDPLGDYRASVERVNDLAATTILPGHGRPITDVPQVIELYRAGFCQRLQRVEAACGEAPETTTAISARAFRLDDAQSAASVWPLHETHAYLSHLLAQRRVSRSEADGLVLWTAAR